MGRILPRLRLRVLHFGVHVVGQPLVGEAVGDSVAARVGSHGQRRHERLNLLVGRPQDVPRLPQKKAQLAGNCLRDIPVAVYCLGVVLDIEYVLLGPPRAGERAVAPRLDVDHVAHGRDRAVERGRHHVAELGEARPAWVVQGHVQRRLYRLDQQLLWREGHDGAADGRRRAAERQQVVDPVFVGHVQVVRFHRADLIDDLCRLDRVVSDPRLVVDRHAGLGQPLLDADRLLGRTLHANADGLVHFVDNGLLALTGGFGLGGGLLLYGLLANLLGALDLAGQSRGWLDDGLAEAGHGRLPALLGVIAERTELPKGERRLAAELAVADRRADRAFVCGHVAAGGRSLGQCFDGGLGDLDVDR